MRAAEEGAPGRSISRPVRLDLLDKEAQVEMNSLIHRATVFGAGIAGLEKSEPLVRLAEAIGACAVDKTAREGLEIEALCKGKTASGRVRRSLEEPLRDAIDLAVRAMLAIAGRPALHEWYASLAVEVGGESNAIGIDKNPNVRAGGHVLLGAVGASDRQLLTQAEWLKAGTRDDHTSPRADRRRIEEFESELGAPIPGPIHEHLDANFEAEDRSRRIAELAAEKRGPIFAQCGIDPGKYLAHYFPRCVILGSLPYGAPTKRGTASAGRLLPGDDDAIAAVVEAHDRYGVAHCTLDEPEVPLENLDDSVLPRLAQRFGEVPQAVDQSLLDAVGAWGVSDELRITENLQLVRYWYLPKAERLLRVMQVSGPDGSEMLELHLWRMIRLRLRAAIALIERAHQPWTFTCIGRFGREFAPGRAQTWKAFTREGFLRAYLIPNAAGVCAFRNMERRLYQG